MKSLLKLSFVLIALLGLSLQACLDNESGTSPEQQLAEDVAQIDAFLTANNVNAIKDNSGVRIQITDLGTGLTPYFKSTVTVAYVGTIFKNVTPFESNTTTGTVSQYIPGWQYALTTLPVGSKATVYIPSPLAYGDVSKPNIPANSILVFDIFIKEMAFSASEKTTFTADTTTINNYLEDKEIIDYVKDPSGVRYVKTFEVETGPSPELYDQVKFTIKLKMFTDDTKEILSVTREPQTGFAGRVVDNIRALSIVLQQMKKGEKATLYIPSYLGFSTDPVRDANGATLVPASTPVIMEIELLDVL